MVHFGLSGLVSELGWPGDAGEIDFGGKIFEVGRKLSGWAFLVFLWGLVMFFFGLGVAKIRFFFKLKLSNFIRKNFSGEKFCLSHFSEKFIL